MYTLQIFGFWLPGGGERVHYLAVEITQFIYKNISGSHPVVVRIISTACRVWGFNDIIHTRTHDILDVATLHCSTHATYIHIHIHMYVYNYTNTLTHFIHVYTVHKSENPSDDDLRSSYTLQRGRAVPLTCRSLLLAGRSDVYPQEGLTRIRWVLVRDHKFLPFLCVSDRCRTVVVTSQVVLTS